MIDKIVFISIYELTLVYTNRSPVSLYCSNGNVIMLLDEFLAPINSHFKTSTEYTKALSSSSEDTVEIDLLEVA